MLKLMQNNRNRSLLPLAVCLYVLCGLQAAPAYDGDVDYGAPYVTLQDGKLVTVDPTKQETKQDAKQQGEHPAQSPAEDTQAAMPATAAGTSTASPEEAAAGTVPVWLYAVLIGAALALAFIVVRSSRRQTGAGGTGYSPEKG